MTVICCLIDIQSILFRGEEKKDFTQLEQFEIPAQQDRPVKTEAETTQWLQSLLLFAICWSFGGTLDGDSRLKYEEYTKNYLKAIHYSYVTQIFYTLETCIREPTFLGHSLLKALTF